MAKETIEMINKENLFQEFDAISTEDWKVAIEKFLKGKPIESLNWEIEEGLAVSPLNRVDTTQNQYIGTATKASNNQWNICETITVGSFDGIKSANQQILEALEKGANALSIELLQLPSPNDLASLFDGVLLNLINIHFKGFALSSSPAMFLQHLSSTPNARDINGSCDFGNISEEDFMSAHVLATSALPNIRLINISIEHSSTQNMSQAIYVASKWIDRLTNKGLNIEQILATLRFEFNVGEHYFVELAFIRAFKKLWFGLLEAYGVEKAIPPFLHVNTKSDQNDNQYWNMIVATTQAMSAAIAGVDSIQITPCNGHDKADEFTRRIARNVQHLLQSESYLDRVIDPASGSYYIENMTAAIANKAWQQFCAL